MSVSKEIYLTLDELKQWLASTESFEPPIGQERFKRITLMMAITMLIKSVREKPRRMKQEVHDTLFDLEEALESFDCGRIENLLKAFLELLTKENPKTCPVQLPVVKVLLYAMADNGLIKPPKDVDITPQVLNTRAVLYTLSKNLAKQAEKEAQEEEKKATETAPEVVSQETNLPNQPDQIPLADSKPQELPSSEQPPPEKPASS